MAHYAAERHEIPVAGGTIVCYRIEAAAAATASRSPESVRPLPVLFLPGWGGIIEGFDEVIEAVEDDVDLYYLETREKETSRLAPEAGFTMADYAADVAAAVGELGLDARGYVLMGSSFGASVALQALAPPPAGADLCPAATVLFEPMPKLWMSALLVRVLAAVEPLGLIAVLKPLLTGVVLAGMRQPVQRRRAALVIRRADTAKWRKAALAMLRWRIFDITGGIKKPVAVIRATGDRFHEESVYPAIAAALPRGELFDIPVPEDEREALMGRIASVYARGGTAARLR
jgi:pimeloyl-ACP methyl ester carboxylesterase